MSGPIQTIRDPRNTPAPAPTPAPKPTTSGTKGAGPARDAGGRIIAFDPRFPNRPNPHQPGTRRWSAWQTAQQTYNTNRIQAQNLAQGEEALEQSEELFFAGLEAGDRRFYEQLAIQQAQTDRVLAQQEKFFKKGQKAQRNQFKKQFEENRRISRESEINANRLRAAQVIEDPNAGLIRRRPADVTRRVASTRGTERLRISTNSI